MQQGHDDHSIIMTLLFCVFSLGTASADAEGGILSHAHKHA